MSRPTGGACSRNILLNTPAPVVSPVAWCEARGLNYATARRYIKNLRKMRRQKCAKLRNKVRRKICADCAKAETENLRKKSQYPMRV